MRRFVLPFLISLVLHISLQSQNLNWALSFGSAEYDYSYHLATDNSGNIFVSGEFSDTVDFDPGIGTHYLTGDSNGDAFVAKYDSSGNFIWVRHIKSAGNDWASALETDASGNVYVTGLFTDTAHFVGTATSVYNYSTGWDVFLAKYSSSGILQWAVSYGGRGSDESYDLTLDQLGNIYVAGVFQDSLIFNGGAINYLALGWSGYVAKFNSSGVFTNLMYTTGGNANARGVIVDNSGNVYCTGVFEYRTFFDSGLYQDSVVGNGLNFDIYMAKYDTNGTLLWAKGIGGNGADFGEDIKLDANGNIYLTGDFENTVDFNPGIGTNNLVSHGNSDVFLAKYTNNGDYIWAKVIGGTSYCTSHEINIPTDGLVYFTGFFEGIADFDGGGGVQSLISAGQSDMFISCYGPSGYHFWSKRFGSAGEDFGIAIDIDVSGALIVLGGFEGTVDFDPGSGINNQISNGNWDVFLARYNIPACEQPDVPALFVTKSTICENESSTVSISLGSMLNGATAWYLYTESCGEGFVGSTNNSFSVSPDTSTTYFVRGEGGCTSPGLCDSISVSVIELDTGIIVQLPKLISKANNVGYQWLLNNSILPGDTLKEIIPIDEGAYSVVVSSFPCVDTSRAIDFGIDGILKTNPSLEVSVYPNPSKNEINIEFEKRIQGTIQIVILNTQGEEVYKLNSKNNETLRFDLPENKGLYLMKIIVDGSPVGTYRVIKE